jgi:hypothetical protein
MTSDKIIIIALGRQIGPFPFHSTPLIHKVAGPCQISYQTITMDAITGWAGKVFMKQKMGEIGGSIGGGNKSETKDGFAKSKEMRQSLQSSRAERDAENARKKEERAAKKGSIAEKWAANKAGK